MSLHNTTRRLSELLIRRFSEPELRRAVGRRFPELADDLPCRPVSLRTLADALVELAERRGCLTDLALELLVVWSRRVSPIRVGLFCVLLVGMTLAIRHATGRPAHDARADAHTEDAHTRTPDVSPATEPGMEPVVPGPLASPPAIRRTEAPQKRRALRVASPNLTPEKPPPALAELPRDHAPEPRSGAAQCSGGLCILSADSGQFLKSEEFCVERAGGHGVERCILHGRLVHPDTTVKCNLSADNVSLTGRVRWSVCSGEP